MKGGEWEKRGEGSGGKKQPDRQISEPNHMSQLVQRVGGWVGSLIRVRRMAAIMAMMMTTSWRR